MISICTLFRRIIHQTRSANLGKPVATAVGILGLAACATVPQPLAGTYPTLNPTQAVSTQANGTQVRWGGEIIKTRPEANQTCFYVLSRPLDDTARPQDGEASQGRFVACHAGFYDPEVFTKGREVTFTGTVHGTTSGLVGKYHYDYPQLQAQTVYLWPKRPRIVRSRGPYYRSPFWGPYNPWFAPPIWYAPRVIYVHRPHHQPPKQPKKD